MREPVLPQYSSELKEKIKQVSNLRARRVLEHILEHGQVTTVELRENYGYEHPPRAARDVRELGFTLVTTRVLGPNGKSIGAYTLVEGEDAEHSGGRRAFPLAFRKALIAHYGEQCHLCGGKFPARALQIDHRVPYLVSGRETDEELRVEDYMLVCGSCNRSKSWSCEHCPNGTITKDPAVCLSCYWGRPEGYTHIATSPRRQVTLNWSGDSVVTYDRHSTLAAEQRMTLEDYIKAKLD